MKNYIQFLNERVTFGEEEVWQLQESPPSFASKYAGQAVDIFFTTDGKASVTKRTSNLIFHGKDGGKGLDIKNVKYVYSGLEDEFYDSKDYGKLLRSVYMGKDSRIKPIKINEDIDFSEKYLTEKYLTTKPDFERLKDSDGVKGYTNNDFKIVRFAYDDEGNNGFALLDIKNKSIISWSLSGDKERKTFSEKYS